MGLKNFGFIGDEYVQRVREKFLLEYETDKDSFNSEDIRKIRNDDWYIKRFLILAYKNEDDATVKLIDAMKWRKEKRIRETEDNYFPKEFFQLGALFIYETDKDGLPMLYMRAKYIMKIPEIRESIKKFTIHKIFEIDEQTYGSGWGVVIDFTDCNYSSYENMDMLHFFITAMHYYFPAGLDYALCYNIPWALKACWTMVKYWIPEKRRKMVQFASGDQIYNFIDKDKIPLEMGGSCKREYKQCPENSPSGVDFGIYELGLTRQEAERIIDIFKPHLQN